MKRLVIASIAASISLVAPVYAQSCFLPPQTFVESVANNAGIVIDLSVPIDRAASICAKHSVCETRASHQNAELWIKPTFPQAFSACNIVWGKWLAIIEERQRAQVKERTAAQESTEINDARFIEEFARSIK